MRLGVSSNEGGTIPEELRVNIARERTEAFGATFMGLTVGCAVCHDHKFDPTTQHDFYALSAFFNNLDEKPFNDDRPVWAPVVRVPKADKEEVYNRILAHCSELQLKLNAMRLDARNLVAHWLAAKKDPARPVSTDGLIVRLRLDEGSGEELKNSAPNRKSRKHQDNDDETGMGRDHLVVARLPHAVQHASAAWASWRLRSEPSFFCGRLVHVPVSAVSSRQFRNAAVENGIDAARPRLGTRRR